MKTSLGRPRCRWENNINTDRQDLKLWTAFKLSSVGGQWWPLWTWCCTNRSHKKEHSWPMCDHKHFNEEPITWSWLSEWVHTTQSAVPVWLNWAWLCSCITQEKFSHYSTASTTQYLWNVQAWAQMDDDKNVRFSGGKVVTGFILDLAI